ncbi:MAG: YbjQ family protein [Candidatus Obscuribacter sp.]|nr:YbjQ family protein [Candidatus Obscuribacter sp.]MBK7836667.1 YbjQ family protein [Candidatus Obscuribacter sp.]MBK9204218.1 YbjQ family protein [Candidatus Obscuribacter sp.]MBK9622625.1 YbjQ family protein [Candidatus Obscuribacter sp.]MBK9773805.1 YbjQ family protein [Candidatus Obscuribacter sp.]
MIVTTTMNVDGYRIVDYKGVVRGMIVRQPTIMQGFKASFKSIVGGTMGSYSEMCEQARNQAYESMVAKAGALGANAIVGMRYDSTAFNASATDMGCEIVAYGTAVTIEPIK